MAARPPELRRYRQLGPGPYQRCSRESGSAPASLKKQVGGSCARRAAATILRFLGGFDRYPKQKHHPKTHTQKISKRDSVRTVSGLYSRDCVARKKIRVLHGFCLGYAYLLAYLLAYWRRGSKFSSMTSGREPASVFRANSCSAAPLALTLIRSRTRGARPRALR